MSEPAPSPQPPAWWRRWLAPQFRLRTLLVVVTVVSVILGTWVTRVRRQMEICAELDRVNDDPFGDVWSFERWNEGEDKAPWWFTALPLALRRGAAEHYWRTVDEAYVDVDYREPAGCLSALKSAGRLPSLQTLTLRGDHQRFDALARVGPEGRETHERLWTAIRGVGPLRSLSVHSLPIDDFAMGIIVESKQLEDLALSKCEFDNDVLRHLGKVQSLKRLNLYGSQLNDDGANHLAALTQLESLSIARTNVTSEGIRSLEKLTNLKDLDLSHTPVDNSCASSIAKLNRLESLVADAVELSDDQVFVAMLGSRELRRVSFENTRAGRRTFETLSTLSKLESANLRMTPVEPGHLAPKESVAWRVSATELLAWRNRPKFATLEIGRGLYDRDDLLALSGAASPVTELHIDFVTMSRDDWRNLAKSPTLTRLLLSGQKDLRDALAEIANVATLTDLVISESTVTDADLAAIGRMQGLQTLDITNGQFSDESFARMPPLPNLRCLRLRSCRGFGDGSVAALAAWPQKGFGELNLEGTGVTDASIDQLKRLCLPGQIVVARSKVTPGGEASLASDFFGPGRSADMGINPDLVPSAVDDSDPFSE